MPGSSNRKNLDRYNVVSLVKQAESIEAMISSQSVCLGLLLKEQIEQKGIPKILPMLTDATKQIDIDDYGTIENYFSEALGIEAATLKKLRDLYLVQK